MMTRLVQFLKRRWLGVNAFVMVSLILFAFGVAVGTFRIAPYGLLEQAAADTRDWVRYPMQNAGLSPQKFLYPAASNGRSSIERRPGAYDGLTFVTGFFGDSNGMRLLDMDGTVVHEWKVSFNHIWPKAPQLDSQPNDWDVQIHGARLYPNGDVVFNFEYAGLVKIDACSRTVWKLAAQTHHSIFKDPSGNLWVPSRKWRKTPAASLPAARPPFWEEFLLEVSPDGKVLRRISILDIIARSHYEGVLFSNGSQTPKVEMPLDHNFTHVNDVEVLTPALAAAFPMFEVGYLLVSVRNLDLLLVVDPGDLKIKWSMVGPFLRQHDPDFTRRGTLSVFDNRRDGAGGALLGGSRILEISPRTRRVTIRYQGNRAHPFYTDTMGAQQYLPNGDVLVTESERGRAFEVDASGKIVWSYLNRWDDEHTALIGRATRYPRSYAGFIKEEESCDEPIEDRDHANG